MPKGLQFERELHETKNQQSLFRTNNQLVSSNLRQKLQKIKHLNIEKSWEIGLQPFCF